MMASHVIELFIEDALQRNNPSELAIGYMRYETLRKLNTRRFAYLNKLNLEGRNFDDMVDEIAAGTFDWSGMMQQEIDILPGLNAISLKHRPDRFACYHCKRWRHNQRFDIAWCDLDHAEFPELCPEYDPKHSHHHA